MTIHVGQGRTVGALTVFPVWDSRADGGERRYATDPALLDLAEVDDGPAVGRLVAGNPGPLPVLVLDGQVFEGGWQHRMAVRSTMVPAEGRTELEVACVEQGRWGGDAGQVGRGRRASTYVRHGYDAGDGQCDGQGEVWRRVAEASPASPTSSYVERMDRADDQAERLLGSVRPLAGQAGVLVGVAGQPLLLEVFDHPDTLREQFEAVVRAAGLDAAGRPVLPTPGRRARRMVERLERTRGAHPDLDVRALREGRRTVHLRATYRRHPVLVGA